MRKLLFLSSYSYPEFDSVFRHYQYEVTKVGSLRKALSSIKLLKPDVIVAEFIYAPTYGSQLSNFESLFAAAQTFAPEVNFIALTHKEDLHHLEEVSKAAPNCQVLKLPATPIDLENCINEIAN